MKNIKNFVLNNKFNFLTIFLWTVLVVFSIFHHELWRDEAQAWCLVRDLNFVDVFKMVRIEGHPIFWYFVLFPFAKLGFPVEVMQGISFLFVFASIIFVLFKSPFNNFQKLLIIFSAGMVYYFPVVARSYSVLPILLFLVAWLYPRKKEHPIIYCFLILIISQVHNYMLGFSVIMFLLLLYEAIKEKNKTLYLPLFILFLNFVFIFLMFFNVQAENYTFDTELHKKISLLSIFPFVGKVFSFEIFNHMGWHNNSINYASWFCFILPLFALVVGFYRANKKIFLIFLFSIGFVFFVFSKVYLYGVLYQKVFLIYLLIIFCFWLLEKEKVSKIITVSFAILFFISVLVSPIVIAKDYKYNYSGAKQMANYIKKNFPNEKVFAAYGNPFVYSAISAYLPEKKFYNPISESYISYFSYERGIHKGTAVFPDEVKYFIIQEQGHNIEEMGFKIVFQTDKHNLSSNVEKEIFKLCVEK